MKSVIAIILCLSSTVVAQDVQITSDEDATIGRLHEVVITASIEQGETQVPADSLLVDVDGKLDYELYENSSKVAYVPNGSGRIKFRIVAVWFDLKIAKQEVIILQAAPPRGPPEDPTDPPANDSKLETLTAEVKQRASRMQDPFTRKSLANVYSMAAKTIKTNQTLEVIYFKRRYSYDMEGDLDLVKSNVTDAISRTMSYSKAQNKPSDSKDWGTGFLQPIKTMVDREFGDMDRDQYAAVLGAIGEGLK